jgi:drug/metabolite transporter (DMT)-like permease
MIKLSHEHPFLLAAYRALVAAVVLTPLYVREARHAHPGVTRAALRSSLLPGALLAVHFLSWIVGARLTPAANSSLVINMVPAVMPLLLLMYTRERMTGAEVIGTALSLSGLVVLGWSDFGISGESFRGDIICFASMLFFAWYLALARRNSGKGSIWLYLVPLYYVSGAVSLTASLAFVNPLKPYPLREVLLILGLGVVPTVIGHSVLNHSMQTMRGQTVALTNLSQVFFAGILAYPLLGEVPAPLFFPALALVVAGAAVVIRAEGGNAERHRA